MALLPFRFLAPFRQWPMQSSQKKRALIAFLTLALVLISHELLPAQTKNSRAGEYLAGIRSSKASYSSLEGGTIEIRLELRNQGRKPWDSQGQNPCLLSYHLLGENSRIVKYDNQRFSFPQKVPPGESVNLTVQVKSPLEAGNYVLEFDLLLEGLSWFKDYGSATLRLPLDVRKDAWPEDELPFSLGYAKATKFESDVLEFNELLKLIRITLRHNQASFKGRVGMVDGFAAGSGYPQIWARDANTIIPTSRYYYGASYLRSWLEEHLARQNPDGSLVDWFDSRGAEDKNTTETDQESGAIQSAYQISRLIGTDWLRMPIGNVRVIDRLENALTFILLYRYDARYGLVTGAHTADWGDVDMSYPDQRAIYVDKNTHWTSDIYDQSMFYESAREIAQLWDSLGRKDKSASWAKRATEIQTNADRWLWQGKKGFYRVHLHLDSLRHDFDDDDIFAMGGNVQAVLSGLAGPEKAKSIIETALVRQKVYRVSTIAGTLLPPYPKGFFVHPALREPFHYQNGGQWDWFGGKLIKIMFESGFSRPAREKLMEIARKDMANFGLYEWDTKEGIGQGSDFYSGSAGSLGRALFEGYLGINLSADSLVLEPRLNQDEARVHIYVPAADVFAAYSYRFDRQKRKVYFDFASNIGKPGILRILNPWAGIQSNSPQEFEGPLEFRKDGKKIAFQRLKIGDDEYLIVATDFQKHSVEIGYFRPTE